jgi:hypothetical protein
VIEIYLSGLKVNEESELSISDFPNLRKIVNNNRENIYFINKVTITDCQKLELIDIRHLRDNKELNINNCPLLVRLDCRDNQITEINIQHFPNLTGLNVGSNCLTSIDLSNNLLLEDISICDNNFPSQDLSFLIHLKNLRILWLGN